MTVGRPELEAFLAALRADCSDPQAGLFGPRSWMWTVSRESALFLGGGRAALLQLAHPYVATAVMHHSRTEGDLVGRFQRTFLHVFAMVFGDLESALGSARRVFGLHQTINGALEEAHGALPAGHRYSANDEAALLWVHATLTDTSLLMFERCVRPLAADEREALYQDTRRFARLFGISDALLPRDWPAFRRYFDETIQSDLLTVGDAGRRMGAFLLKPPNARVAPLWRWYTAVTAGLLPERLRAAFGLPWARRDRLLCKATLAAARATPLLPAQVRFVPAYLDARRRLRGLPTRDPVGAWAEKLVLKGMRQET